MPLNLDRRSLLAAMSSTAMLAVAGNAAAGKRRPFFERIHCPIGLQLYVLGEAPRRDFAGTLAQVAKLGYRDIELPELYGLTPAAVRAAANDAGLTIGSRHIPADNRFNKKEIALTGDMSRLADEMGVLGTRLAALPILPFPDGFFPSSIDTFGRDILKALTADHWKRTAALLNEKGAQLKAQGIELSYHNHNIEFAPIAGGSERGWDVLLRELDPNAVYFEVDTGWLGAAGIDPTAFLNGLRGRVRQLHVKDLKAGTSNFTINLDPAVIGAGILDWERVLPAAHRAGVRHFYVEQEPPFTIPRMEWAAQSYQFLAGLRA